MQNKHIRPNEIKVIVAIDDHTASSNLINFFAESGIFARGIHLGDDLKNLISTWNPDFVIVDLFFSQISALLLLKTLKQTEQLNNGKMRVFVTSQHHNNISNVKECLRWGASDYLIMPFKHMDVLARVVLHMQAKRELKDLSSKEALLSLNESQYYIHLTSLTLKEAMKDTALDLSLYNLTKMVSMAMKAVRVSIVQCDVENRTGIVHASSDNRDMKQLQLDLDKYPEILYTLQSQKLLAIDNLDADPTMKIISQQSKSINFSSIMVVPIELPQGTWGVLSARMPQTRGRFEDVEIQFVQLVAYVLSMVIQKHQAPQAQKSAA
jgi:DNA-binding response OmpR family regulator